MRELETLSKIGFGCYRTSRDSATHRTALHRALDLGCTLVDTASNYMNGESEMLIGEVLCDRGEIDAFVVTKAGYVDKRDAGFLSSAMGISASRALLRTTGGTIHCIHPDFLQTQIERSLRRLHRNFIDGFLLHNPEYYFESDNLEPRESEFYRRVEDAFGFLERMVAKGTVRFYGVSSNVLPLGDHATVTLKRLIQAARGVSDQNHFRLIQLPCNLAEKYSGANGAGGPAVAAVARRHGVTTIANRPLNAVVGGRLLRLAATVQDSDYIGAREVRSVLERVVAVLDNRLKRLGVDGSAADLSVIRGLKTHWEALDSTEAVEQVFKGALYPLVRRMYEDGTQKEDLGVFDELYACAMAQARAAMNRAALEFRARLVDEGRIANNDRRPLQVIACDSILKAGIDHVLVGMRRPEYVEDLKALF